MGYDCHIAYPGLLCDIDEKPAGFPLKKINEKQNLEDARNKPPTQFYGLCDHSDECYESPANDFYQNLPDPEMISSQPELRWYMRRNLINFLIGLHSCFKLEQETLFLACSICDRYLSKRIVYKKHYKLTVAITLWIAAKYEEKKSRIPTLEDLIILCDDANHKSMFLEMERHILNTLHWEIRDPLNIQACLDSCIGSQPFIASNYSVSKSLINIASYLCEISLYEKNYLYLSSGIRATSAVLLASKIYDDDRFPTYLSKRLLNTTINAESLSFQFSLPKSYNLPFMQFTDTTIDDIRSCCILYLSDLYKQKISNCFEVVSKKYSGTFVSIFIDEYISRYYEFFITVPNFSYIEEFHQDVGIDEKFAFGDKGMIDHLIGILKIETDLNISGDSLFEAHLSNTNVYPVDTRDVEPAIPFDESYAYVNTNHNVPPSNYGCSNSMNMVSPPNCITPLSLNSTCRSSVFSGDIRVDNSTSFPSLDFMPSNFTSVYHNT